MSATTSTAMDTSDKIAVLKRAYEREKARRLYAEKMLEDKSRDLYLSKLELEDSHDKLSETADKLQDQRLELEMLAGNYDRVTQDLSYAAKVQNSLLPKPLILPSAHSTGVFIPSQYIAGDGYDFFKLDEHVLAFYEIDVAGHGIAAAMTSFAVQVQLNPKPDGLVRKHFSPHKPLTSVVESIMGEVNHIFYHEHPDAQYFTMIFGLLDLDTGEVAFSQAGHPPPILWNAETGKASTEGKGGTPVAMFDVPSFGTYQFNMNSGDRLLIYSDGVTECRNADDIELGYDNLTTAFCSASTTPMETSKEKLVRYITEWNGSEVFEDDLTLVIIELR